MGNSKKPIVLAESLDSIDAYYKRFSGKNSPETTFDCCSRTLEIDAKRCNELTNSFNSLSINETTSTSSSSKRKKRKRRKSGPLNHRRRLCANRISAGKPKFSSTSDLTTNSKSSVNKDKLGIRSLLDLNDNPFVHLSDHLHVMSSSIPNLSSQGFDKISDHDRKILQRMVLKRTKEIAMIQDAQLARDYWEKEQAERKKIIEEQNESYFRTIRRKREQEALRTRTRLKRIAMEENAYIERLKQELIEKEAKTEKLRKDIELHRDLKLHEKRQREFQKQDATLLNQQEHEVNDEIWRQILIERLQERIHKADALRQKVLEVHKTRIQADNQLEQTMHQANYEETVKVEQFKQHALRERIRERDEKCKSFIRQRSRLIEESQKRAKASAALRDLIKRSISPENIKFDDSYSPFLKPIGSIANSYRSDSHIILG